MKRLSIILCLIAIAQLSFAQRRKTNTKRATTTSQASATRNRNSLADTTKPQNVTVTSAFKPVLRSNAKVNFSAASAISDSSKPAMLYNIPSQSLFFSYQPVTLKPLALGIDSAESWVNNSYIKVGYGNFSSPYAEVGASFGDGAKTIVNLRAKHISSKGQLTYQQFSKTGVDALGIFQSPNNKTEWTTKLFFDNSTQYFYGYKPDTLKFNKDKLKQALSTFGIKAGLRNKTKTSFGLDYNPTLGVTIFTDNHSGSETSFVLDAPITKSIFSYLDFSVGLTADMTAYKSDSASVNNNLFLLTPQLNFKTPNVKFNAGFTPSWDNSTFTLLPNFTAEAKIKDEKFKLMVGWMGYYNKTTYQSLTSQNPWIQQPKSLLNTRIAEQYAGLKGSAGSHLTYNAKVSFLKFTNMPLFINDTIDGKTFRVINEAELKAIRIHGEVGYTEKEKFSLLAGITFNQFSNQATYGEAYGLLPMELTGSLRWKVLKDINFKMDAFFWDGAKYRNLGNGKNLKSNAAFDLNAGVEFSILPKLNLWLQMNNIFNSKYERWNQYQSLGFNVLAGVVYNFGKK
jgi:hypothetical protein